MSIVKKIRQGSFRTSRKTTASFVSIEEPKRGMFKYKPPLIVLSLFVMPYDKAKQKVNSVKSRIALLLNLFDWRRIRNDLSEWVASAFIEGFALNFIMAVLFGLPINLFTILAYGMLAKVTVHYWWRLKKDGTPATIPHKEP